MAISERTLTCLRCGAELLAAEVTVRISNVIGFADGTLWLHGAGAKGWGVMGPARDDSGKMNVEVAKQGTKFCGPVVLKIDAKLDRVDQDIVLGHVRAALFRAFSGEAAMAVIAYIERLVWCAVALRTIYARLGPIPLDTGTGRRRASSTRAIEQIEASRLDNCRHAASGALQALHGAGALTRPGVELKQQLGPVGAGDRNVAWDDAEDGWTMLRLAHDRSDGAVVGYGEFSRGVVEVHADFGAFIADHLLSSNNEHPGGTWRGQPLRGGAPLGPEFFVFIDIPERCPRCDTIAASCNGYGWQCPRAAGDSPHCAQRPWGRD